MKTFIRIIVLFLWAVFPGKTFSQSFCGGSGGFKILPTANCFPKTIIVENEATGVRNPQYVYDFDRNQSSAPDSKAFESTAIHTYDKPGTYTILQVREDGTKFCNDVVVREGRAPDASIVSCNNHVRIKMELSAITLAYDYVEVDWGDGSPKYIWVNGGRLYVDHEYTTPQANPVIITGIYAEGDCKTSLPLKLTGSTVNMLSSVKIKSLEIQNDGQANLIYPGIDGVSTEVLIDKGTGVFESTGKSSNLDGIQKVTISGLNINQVYRFKLFSQDICANRADSPIVSSVTVKQGSLALDEIISLEWNSLPNTERLVEYQVTRNDAVVFNTPDALSYIDKDVKCGVDYTYSVVAIIENDVRSYSPDIVIKPSSSTPEKIQNASVSVISDNQIETSVSLTGEGLTSTYDLIVERAEGRNGNFVQISAAGNQNLAFEDDKINASQKSYCYQFIYQNACGLKSEPSVPVCSVYLSGNMQGVSWTSDSPFLSELESYELILKDKNGGLVDQVPKHKETSHPINLSNDESPVVGYQVKAVSLNGAVSYSNIFRLITDPILLVPDTFTPNGDSHNERFEVKGYFIDKYNISIFNRWGSVVFQSSSITDSWDGKLKNVPVPSGYYFYKIESTDSVGGTLIKTGSLLLIK